jgi:hypothetical protein
MPKHFLLAQELMREKIAKILAGVNDNKMKFKDSEQFDQSCDLLTSIGVIYITETTTSTIYIPNQTGNANIMRRAQLQEMLFPYRQLPEFGIYNHHEGFEFMKTFSKETMTKILEELFPKYKITVDYSQKSESWGTRSVLKSIKCEMTEST